MKVGIFGNSTNSGSFTTPPSSKLSLVFRQPVPFPGAYVLPDRPSIYKLLLVNNIWPLRNLVKFWTEM